MRKVIRAFGVLVAALVLSGTAGCGRSSPRNQLKARLPAEQVNLPPRPSLSARPAPEKYQDGALTVEGFLRTARDSMGKEVMLRGYVLEVKTCPAEQERCETVPHLTLVDDLSSKRRKVFVVADPPHLFFKDIHEKSQQTLTGNVAMWSPDGRLINLDGMLVVKLAVPATGGSAPARSATAE